MPATKALLVEIADIFRLSEQLRVAVVRLLQRDREAMDRVCDDPDSLIDDLLAVQHAVRILESMIHSAWRDTNEPQLPGVDLERLRYRRLRVE